MGKSRKGAHSLNNSLANPKTKVKVGCWNVRTMFSVGKTAQITAEMTRYGIGILGISEVKNDFYEQLQKIVDEVPRHDMLLVIGDWNAKVGEQQLGEKEIVGRFGMAGERSDNGERFVPFCALNNLAIASTTFPHKEIHRHTWTSPNGQYHNQNDHVAVRSNFKRSVQDVRAYRGADCASDHNLVIAKTLLKLNRSARRVVQVRRYETSKLNVPEIRKKFQLELKNRFSCLVIEDDCDENRQEDEGEVARRKSGKRSKTSTARRPRMC